MTLSSDSTVCTCASADPPSESCSRRQPCPPHTELRQRPWIPRAPPACTGRGAWGGQGEACTWARGSRRALRDDRVSEDGRDGSLWPQKHFWGRQRNGARSCQVSAAVASARDGAVTWFRTAAPRDRRRGPAGRMQACAAGCSRTPWGKRGQAGPGGPARCVYCPPRAAERGRHTGVKGPAPLARWGPAPRHVEQPRTEPRRCLTKRWCGKAGMRAP